MRICGHARGLSGVPLRSGCMVGIDTRTQNSGQSLDVLDFYALSRHGQEKTPTVLFNIK